MSTATERDHTRLLGPELYLQSIDPEREARIVMLSGEENGRVRRTDLPVGFNLLFSRTVNNRSWAHYLREKVRMAASEDGILQPGSPILALAICSTLDGTVQGPSVGGVEREALHAAESYVYFGRGNMAQAIRAVEPLAPGSWMATAEQVAQPARLEHKLVTSADGNIYVAVLPHHLEESHPTDDLELAVNIDGYNIGLHREIGRIEMLETIVVPQGSGAHSA